MGLKNLNIKLLADLSQFSSSMQNAQRQMQKTSKAMEKVGKSMSTYITAPIIGLAAVSFAAFSKQEESVNKLNASLRANGKDVQAVSKDYQNYASELQKVTTIGDETTIELMQMAETMQMKDVKGGVTAAIGLSKALGIDLKTALQNVAKAQEGNYRSLGQLVPKIKNAGSASEKAAIAQKLFADGFEIAKAEAESGMGPMVQMKNAVGDLLEKFGEIVAQGLKPFIKFLKETAEGFQNLSDGTKKTIVLILSIAAAIGPVILVIGKMIAISSKVIGIIKSITVAVEGMNFAFLSNPFTYVVLAVAALIAWFVILYKKTGSIGGAFKLMGLQSIAALKTSWEYLKAFSLFVWDVSKFLIKILVLPFKILAETIVDVFKSLPSAIKAIISGDFASAGKIMMKALKDPITKEVDSMISDFKKLGDPFTQATENTKKLWKEVAVATKELTKLNTAAEPIKNVNSAGTSGGKGGSGKGGAALPVRLKLNDDPIKPIQRDLDNISISNPLEAPVKLDLSYMNAASIEAMQKLDAIKQNFNESFNALINDTLVTGFNTLGESMGSLITGEIGIAGFFNNILGVLFDFAGQFGKILIAMGVAKIALDSLFTGPQGPFLAIAGGVALIAASAALKKLVGNGMKFAEGGIVGGNSFTGDRIPALVNSGEMILNGNQQANLWKFANGGGTGGSNTVTVVGKIAGNDIRLSNLRSTNRYGRI